MKILITGASGFIGRNFIYFLSKTNHEVLAIYNSNKPKLRYKNVKYLQFHLGNKDYKVLQRFKPQIIFHLAAQSIVSLSYKKPLETFRTNILGSANILESIRINNVPNLVYITSDKCYLNLDKTGSYKESDILGNVLGSLTSSGIKVKRVRNKVNRLEELFVNLVEGSKSHD